MSSQKVLLLNASNMDAYPIFPYAFVQVPAVARRVGVEVICKDMLGIPPKNWGGSVQALIDRHNPDMILITLRNTESFTLTDYVRDVPKVAGSKSYFPIERTKELINNIRAISDLKITLGGFAFSLLANEIMHHLRPDFGVIGGGDGFFAQFEDILAENLEKIANLLYFQGDQLISNPRKFYPPLTGTEYTSQVIEEMMGFYEDFPKPGFLGAPIEIMRGCSNACVFCSEPHVLGRQVRYRDLSAVMSDIEILVNHGITRMYMISSELNPESNDYVLELAERIYAFNAQQVQERKITWYGANYLLNFDLDEFECLYRSGFTGGWFDITALDDENARAMRTPYHNKKLIPSIKAYAQIKRTLSNPPPQKEAMDNEADVDRKDQDINWSMFLGNPATTTETIRNTLRVANREGFAQQFTKCSINTYTRVFDYEEPDQATLAVTFSVTPDLDHTSYQQMLPSFAYPPTLLEEFGSEEEIESMFQYIAETYLSTRYENTRNWQGFIYRNASLTSISSWIAELANFKGVELPELMNLTAKEKVPESISRLFSDELQEEEKTSLDSLAEQVANSLLAACLEAFPDQFGLLDLPNTMDELAQMTPYELALAVHNRWRSEADLIDQLNKQTESIQNESMREFIRFCVRVMLYRFNVVLNPMYRNLFIAGDHTSKEAGNRYTPDFGQTPI